MAESSLPFIAFEGATRIARGDLHEVALKTQAVMTSDPHARVLVFNACTSELIDFDHRGSPEQMQRSLAATHPRATGEPTESSMVKAVPAGPGRPRLGVVAREVTLLPRHWEWLNGQPGGASVALRKLVEQARRDNQTQDQVRQAQEACYRFMAAMAGDLGGFEEAARTLFSGECRRFDTLLAAWPEDIREHLRQLAEPAVEHRWNEGKHHA